MNLKVCEVPECAELVGSLNQWTADLQVMVGHDNVLVHVVGCSAVHLRAAVAIALDAMDEQLPFDPAGANRA